MGRPKSLGESRRPLHALLGPDDEAKWDVVMASLRKERDMPDLTESECVRLMIREAHAARTPEPGPTSSPASTTRRAPRKGGA